MVKATRKPLEEIHGELKGYRKVLAIGCGGCASVCLAGGQRETEELAVDLAACAQPEAMEISTFTVERQCNGEFLAELGPLLADCDCVISLACGAGVQNLADAYPDKPVFPALDTRFVGVDIDIGLYEERCRCCGSCQLAFTAGICPVTRCSKSLLNGPCGGTTGEGHCELGADIPCAWKEIYDRLAAQGRLEIMMTFRPPMEWIDKGPGRIVQRGWEKRYAGTGSEAENR